MKEDTTYTPTAAIFSVDDVAVASGTRKRPRTSKTTPTDFDVVFQDTDESKNNSCDGGSCWKTKVGNRVYKELMEEYYVRYFPPSLPFVHQTQSKLRVDFLTEFYKRIQKEQDQQQTKENNSDDDNQNSDTKQQQQTQFLQVKYQGELVTFQRIYFKRNIYAKIRQSFEHLYWKRSRCQNENNNKRNLSAFPPPPLESPMSPIVLSSPSTCTSTKSSAIGATTMISLKEAIYHDARATEELVDAVAEDIAAFCQNATITTNQNNDNDTRNSRSAAKATTIASLEEMNCRTQKKDIPDGVVATNNNNHNISSRADHCVMDDIGNAATTKIETRFVAPTQFSNGVQRISTIPSFQTSPSSLSSSLDLWQRYKDFCWEHHWSLDALDEGLSKLLFWLPHTNSDGDNNIDNEEENQLQNEALRLSNYCSSYDAAWREVGYGILSLHRLFLHLALVSVNDDTTKNNGQVRTIDASNSHNHYGTSVRTRYVPIIPAKSLRIGITVLQSLIPSFVSLAMLLLPKTSNTKINHKHRKQPPTSGNKTVRLMLERAIVASNTRMMLETTKFLLRFILLVTYWKQQEQQKQPSSHTTDNNDDDGMNAVPTMDFGIMINGGLYDSEGSQDELVGLSWDRAQALQRKSDYVGERTGWRTYPTNKKQYRCLASTTEEWWEVAKSRILGFFGPRLFRNAQTTIAELLYISRPLVWAWYESQQYSRQQQNYHHQQQQQRKLYSSSRRWNGTNIWKCASFTTNHSTLSPYTVRKQLNNTCHSQRENLFQGWLVCLAMDLLSIRLLDTRQNVGGTNNDNYKNSFERDEIGRRKLRLFLYLLRMPVWSTQTLPILEKFSENLLRRIPILGNLSVTILWDWVLYYRHPFVAEEG